MGKLFKFMKPYAATILMIVVFLVLQAYCDLSLPGYTSDIVNVGIQQGGIDTAIPEQISVEDMDRLFLFVSEKNQKTVLDAYERDTDTYESEAYVLKDGILKDEKRTDKIGVILSKPMMLVTVFSSDSEETKEMTDAMFASLPKEMLSEDMTVFDVLGMMPEEQRAQMVTQIGEKDSDWLYVAHRRKNAGACCGWNDCQYDRWIPGIQSRCFDRARSARKSIP